MRESGDIFNRKLDRKIGIPLVFLAGIGRRALFGKRTPPSAPKALGIICFGAIGDLLLTTVLINALRSRHPTARIYVYVSAANAGALALLPGECVCRSFAIGNFGGIVRALYPQIASAPSIAIPDIPPGNWAGGDPEALTRTVFMHMWASGGNPGIKEWTPTDEICSIAGKTSLPELAWLFSRSAAIISVNTGIVHLAGLSGAPTIDLHGPTTPERWGAYGPRTVHVSSPDEHGGYLYLGFEFPQNAYPVLHTLPASHVVSALRRSELLL